MEYVSEMSVLLCKHARLNACERLDFLNIIQPSEDFVDFSKAVNIEGDGACNHPVFSRKLHIRHIYVIIFGNGIEYLNEQPHFVDTFDSDGLLVGVGSGDVPGGRKKVLSVLGFMARSYRTLHSVDLYLSFQVAVTKHFVQESDDSKAPTCRAR